jgi:hypothetical protein
LVIAKAQPSAPPENAEAFDRLIARFPAIERKGATMPYTSMNGNMFSYLDAEGSMALRLASSDRADFMAAFAAQLHEAYGFIQQEYVTVPAALLADTDRLVPWFERSVAYAATLRPKPTTKKKS